MLRNPCKSLDIRFVVQSLCERIFLALQIKMLLMFDGSVPSLYKVLLLHDCICIIIMILKEQFVVLIYLCTLDGFCPPRARIDQIIYCKEYISPSGNLVSYNLLLKQ